MPVPEPQPGLVLRYAYLWRSEKASGREEGTKDRPCVVVLATRRTGNTLTVVVAPVTHSMPQESGSGIEIPAAVKARLKLDRLPSWVITTEVNVFTWPGPDLRPIDARADSRGYAYGYLPSRLTRAVLDGVRDQMRRGSAATVRRD